MRKNNKSIIQDLEHLLQIKEETIKELQKQVEIMKSKPSEQAVNPFPPGSGVLPYTPGQQPNLGPWWGVGPYTIISGTDFNLINKDTQIGVLINN